MGKKTDRSLKGGAPASANSRGDDSSTPEPYNCSGSFPEDFEQIWQRNCPEKDFAPVVRPRGRPPSPPEDPKSTPQGEEEDAPKDEDPPPQTYSTVENSVFFKPSIQCELEVEETKQGTINHAQQLHIKGWRIEEKLISVLKLCSLERLSSINLWHTGLTEHTFQLLVNFLPALPSIKSMSIEGNPIAGSEPFADILVNKDLQIQHLSLRNNKMTDVGAVKIGKALGSALLPSPELLTLNLGFNHIGDVGAKSIANGLRMNRVLTNLSLASNRITDDGAKAFASILNWFDLTHEEIVQRRKLMSEKGISGRGSSAPGSRRGDSKDRPSSNRSGSQVDKSRQGGRGSSKGKDGRKGGDKIKKDDKGKKDAGKLQSKTSIVETPKSKNRKSGGKDGKKGQVVEVDSPDLYEQTHPLLDNRISHEDGKVIMPGCTSLLSLNLSRNQIGVAGMRSLLKVIKRQSFEKDSGNLSSSAPGLLKLSLQKNNVPIDNDTCSEIYQIMIDKDPNKPDTKTPDDELQSVVS